MTQTGLIAKRLDGKIAVVTGGSSGIGLATAKRFIDEGAYVFIVGRRQSEINAAVNQIGKNVIGVQGDVSNLEDLDSLYDTVKQQKGRIDVLFANAGMAEFAPLGSITESHFDKIFSVNVKGLLFTVQIALPLFQNGGSIILTASIGGSKGFEGVSVYSATKAAYTFVRAFLDRRSETPQDPSQRHQSWSDRHTHDQQYGTKSGTGREVQDKPPKHHTTG